jgi:hypothetical protein
MKKKSKKKGGIIEWRKRSKKQKERIKGGRKEGGTVEERKNKERSTERRNEGRQKTKEK